MTTSEALFALKLILEADWMYSNYANDADIDVPRMNDDQLSKANALFEAIVGPSVAQRLTEYVTGSHASPEDLHAISQDAGELMKLAAIIGITQ